MDLGNGVWWILVQDQGDGSSVPALPLELLVRALHNSTSLVGVLANSILCSFCMGDFKNIHLPFNIETFTHCICGVVINVVSISFRICL